MIVYVSTISESHVEKDGSSAGLIATFFVWSAFRGHIGTLASKIPEVSLHHRGQNGNGLSAACSHF
ncbi:hypothetical protein FRAAL4664 [Frankia alni ACN14a]|uniref:Uncharacterized protein n=1 Tax=Frankia alni (strain DSM 45986 / CECT 9034 / ACN14a) TaxID=326424 RepID=Q0RGT0_FRAAA|nr:hypothetical protein FRAAL4664 [Frankia alni ACN14a]